MFASFWRDVCTKQHTKCVVWLQRTCAHWLMHQICGMTLYFTPTCQLELLSGELNPNCRRFPTIGWRIMVIKMPKIRSKMSFSLICNPMTYLIQENSAKATLRILIFLYAITRNSLAIYQMETQFQINLLIYYIKQLTVWCFSNLF